MTDTLFDVVSLQPLTVVCGHYGVGKTNLVLNLAFDAAAQGYQVCVVDLDVVNPYFRSSDYREALQEAGVRLVAPVMAGTTLDAPGLSPQVLTAIGWCGAAPGRITLIDAGGDDVGATALGRFAHAVKSVPYGMFYVVNQHRAAIQHIDGAASVLAEIEQASRLKASALVNNTHLATETNEQIYKDGLGYAQQLSSALKLPLVFSTYPRGLDLGGEGTELRYPVTMYVKKPWE